MWMMYFEDEDNDCDEDGETVETVLVVPDPVVLLISHPRLRDEDEEDDVHDLEEDDETEDLDRSEKYDFDGTRVLLADQVEVSEEEQDEVVVGANEAAPC